jgi:hypothetical protein
LCTSCLAGLKFPEERDAKRFELQRVNSQVRKQAELPGGTIITLRSGEIADINPRRNKRFSGAMFAVAMDDWDLPYLEDIEPNSTAHLGYQNIRTGGWIDDGAIVILGGFVFAGKDGRGRDIPAGWLILRPLQRPFDPPACEQIVSSGVALTQDQRNRLDAARGAFLERLDPRGRPSGSGRFETRQDFESAVFRAVAQLVREKRALTQKNIGAYLIAKHGRNATKQKRAGDSPADPARQFRDWRDAFNIDSEDLIQRALAHRANES